MADENNNQAQVQNDIQLDDQQEAQQVQKDADLQKRLAWAKDHSPEVYDEISGNSELSHAEIVIMLDDAHVPEAEDITDGTNDDNASDSANQPAEENTAGDGSNDATTSDAQNAQYAAEQADATPGTDPDAEEAADPATLADDEEAPARTQAEQAVRDGETLDGGVDHSVTDEQSTTEPATSLAQAEHRDANLANSDSDEAQQRSDELNRDAQELVGVENADQKAPEDGSMTDGGTPTTTNPDGIAQKPAEEEVSQPEADTTATSTIDEPTDEKKDIQNDDSNLDERLPDDTDILPEEAQPAHDLGGSDPDSTPSTDPHAIDPTAITPQTPGTDPVAESSAYSIDGQPDPDAVDVHNANNEDQQKAESAPNSTESVEGRDTDALSKNPLAPEEVPNAPIEGASEAQANQPTPTDGRRPDEVDQKPMAKDKEPTALPQTPGDLATGTSDGVNSLTAPEATDLVTSKTHKSSDPSTMVQLDTSAQANDFVKSDEDDVRNNPGPNPNARSAIPSPSDVLGDRSAQGTDMQVNSQRSVPVARLNDTLKSYVDEMASNKSHSDAEGGNIQRQLYRAIQNVVYTEDTGDFVAGMNLLLDTIDEQSTGVFSERNAFRFWPHISLPQSERLEFENLMRLFVNLGPKDGRKESLKHTDLNSALQYTRNDAVKERLTQYIKKITS